MAATERLYALANSDHFREFSAVIINASPHTRLFVLGQYGNIGV